MALVLENAFSSVMLFRHFRCLCTTAFFSSSCSVLYFTSTPASLVDIDWELDLKYYSERAFGSRVIL